MEVLATEEGARRILARSRELLLSPRVADVHEDSTSESADGGDEQPGTTTQERHHDQALMRKFTLMLPSDLSSEEELATLTHHLAMLLALAGSENHPSRGGFAGETETNRLRKQLLRRVRVLLEEIESTTAFNHSVLLIDHYLFRVLMFHELLSLNLLYVVSTAGWMYERVFCREKVVGLSAAEKNVLVESLFAAGTHPERGSEGGGAGILAQVTTEAARRAVREAVEQRLHFRI